MKLFVVILQFFLIFNWSSAVEPPKTVAYIEDVEKYLNDITTFEADFIQLDKYGRRSSGRFFLKRPYLMKIDYIDPPTHVVIAKDNKIIHYNRELKEKTETSTYSSPLSFFLERKINLQSKIKVLSIQDESDFLSIKFCKKNENEDGAVTLVFSKNPLTLRKWIIFSNKKDELSYENTEISLINWKSKHFISNKEFEKLNR
ncbi:MAG: outer membrane lipoprotein carrier protein LolA [Holosporaceae bacterium]|jgi:outer membrane lipoprotein-sorting protein|nr:outer membrane lipoprotein carrier protein LolA [Holosporaceae bacterium]